MAFFDCQYISLISKGPIEVISTGSITISHFLFKHTLIKCAKCVQNIKELVDKSSDEVIRSQKSWQDETSASFERINRTRAFWARIACTTLSEIPDLTRFNGLFRATKLSRKTPDRWFWANVILSWKFELVKYSLWRNYKLCTVCRATICFSELSGRRSANRTSYPTF